MTNSEAFESLTIRLSRLLDRPSATAHWRFLGKYDPRHGARISFNAKLVTLQRAVWALAHAGELPPPYKPLRRECQGPTPCYNPAHWALAVTPSQEREIRRLYQKRRGAHGTKAALARRFGVAETTVTRILKAAETKTKRTKRKHG